MGMRAEIRRTQAAQARGEIGPDEAGQRCVTSRQVADMFSSMAQGETQ